MKEINAGVIIIGNEILSGKTVDTNSSFLAKELRELGVSLRRIAVIPDEMDVISETVAAFHSLYDIVFTSGGVGPTHDDITIAGVARAFGRQVIRHPVLEKKLRAYLNGRKANEASLQPFLRAVHKARVFISWMPGLPSRGARETMERARRRSISLRVR